MRPIKNFFERIGSIKFSPRALLSAFLIFTIILIVLKLLAYQFFSNILKNIPQPTVPVYVSQLQWQQWKTHVFEPATIASSEHIEVMSKTHGFIQDVHVQTGQLIEQQGLLVTLENKEQLYSLEKGKVAEKLASSSYRRSRDLFEKNMISSEKFEEDTAAFKNAQAQRQYLETLVDNTIIKAPFPGRVDSIDLSPGQFIQAGTPLFNLTSLPPYQVKFTLPERYFSFVKVADSAQITVVGTTLRSQISEIGQVVDKSTRRFNVRANFDENHDDMIVGGSARVQLEFALNKENAHIVQLEALDFTPMGPAIWTYRSQDEQSSESTLIAESIVVSVVDQNDQYALIEAPQLQPNMPIISSGFQKLRRGSKIKIVAPKERI